MIPPTYVIINAVDALSVPEYIYTGKKDAVALARKFSQARNSSFEVLKLVGRASRETVYSEEGV